MFSARYCLAVLVLFALLPAVPAVAPPVGPSSTQIARWIEELGDDSFSVREAASKKLGEAGESAEAALEKATMHTDAEIVKRARTILQDFRWGIYPDTPASVVELIRSYRSAAGSEKQAIIGKLLTAGSSGCRALIKIARNETDALVRKETFTSIGATFGKSSGKLLTENRPVLESLLELLVAGDTRAGAPHYAAYYLLTGGLDARIAQWEARAKKAVGAAKAEYETLAYLYRARGDLDKAVKAADEAERTDLAEACLYEQGNWKALDRRPTLIDPTDTVRALGYRTAYARLAGNTKVFDAGLADLIKQGQNVADQRDFTLPYAKALFFNDRPLVAIDLLRKGAYDRGKVYELYVARLAFKDAFTLVEEARKGGPAGRDLPMLEIHQARTLHLFGEKDKAIALLKKYTDQIKPGGDREWYADLVESEARIGRRDQAFAVIARVLAASNATGWPNRLFEKLYDKKGDEVAQLWTLLGKLAPMDSKEKVLARLRPLADGKASVKDIDALIRDVKEHVKTLKPEEAATAWRLVGEACVNCKQTDRAFEAFRHSNSPQSLVRLGDLLAQKKQWASAAVQYHTAYKRGLETDPTKREDDNGDAVPALALYLSGQALLKAGQTAEGKRQIDLARLLSLGDAEMRLDVARSLTRRGYRDLARGEQRLLRLIGEPSLSESASYYTGEGLRAAAIAAADRKEYLKAADGFEQAFLRCMHATMNFSRAQAYVLVPAFTHFTRARGLIAAKKFDLAQAEIDHVKTYVPGYVEMAMKLVPELDQMGQKKMADSVYRAVVTPYEKIIKEHPKCAWALNQMAWLSACTRRDLGLGEKYGRQAIALLPDTAAYHDTLAEVLFQMGKKNEAIAAQKKAVSLDPDREYFRKQLRRIEAGDPKAERPDEDD